MSEESLRAKAEAYLINNSTTETELRTAQELLHELQVHQVELEMQNEELRRMHNALEASRDRYVDLYEFAPVGYLILTAEGMITEINLTGAKLLGIERNILINKRFARFIVDQDKDSWYHLLQNMKVRAEDKEQNIELRLLLNNRSLIHAHLDCRRMDVIDGPHVLRVSLTDISKLKQTELELFKSEEHFRALFESSTDAIMTIAPDLKFTSCNRASLNLFDVANEQEFKKLHLVDLCPELQPDGGISSLGIQRRIDTALSQGSIFFEWTHKQLNGKFFTASVLLTRVKINDELLIQATVRDITEQKDNEKSLREQNSLLERFNRAMVGRELNIIALKQKVNELSTQLGQEPPYSLSFLDAPIEKP